MCVDRCVRVLADCEMTQFLFSSQLYVVISASTECGYLVSMLCNTIEGLIKNEIKHDYKMKRT